MFRVPTVLLCGLLLLVACGGTAGMENVRLPAPSTGNAGFDQALVDSPAHLLFLADDGSQAIDVLDISTDTPRFIKAIPMGSFPKGLALDDQLHRLLVGLNDGKLGIVDVDPKSHGFLHLILRADVGANSLDLLGYDGRDHKIYAGDRSHNQLVVVDVRNVPVARIPLALGIEQPVYDPVAARVWVTNSVRDSIYEIDPGTDKVVAEHRLGMRCQPTGFALDAVRRAAVVSCSIKSGGGLVAFDMNTFKVVATFSQTSDAGQALYDRAADRYIVAGASGGHSSVSFLGGSPIRFLNYTQTRADTRAVAYDPARRMVYQPAAHGTSAGLAAFKLPDATRSGAAWWLPLLYIAIVVAILAPVIVIGRRRAEERRKAGRPVFS